MYLLDVGSFLVPARASAVIFEPPFIPFPSVLLSHSPPLPRYCHKINAQPETKTEQMCLEECEGSQHFGLQYSVEVSIVYNDHDNPACVGATPHSYLLQIAPLPVKNLGV